MKKLGLLLCLLLGLTACGQVEYKEKEEVFATLDEAIEAAAADYQELTRLLGEKEEAEAVLLDLMEQWENAQA